MIPNGRSTRESGRVGEQRCEFCTPPESANHAYVLYGHVESDERIAVCRTCRDDEVVRARIDDRLRDYKEHWREEHPEFKAVPKRKLPPKHQRSSSFVLSSETKAIGTWPKRS